MINKLLTLSASFSLLAISALPAFAADSNSAKASTQAVECTKIQDGVLTYTTGHYLEGQQVTTDYDAYGYNYQSHQFKGSYANVHLGRYGLPPYGGDDNAYYQELINLGKAADLSGAKSLLQSLWPWAHRSYDIQMKWNDTWLANTDCNGDGKLDRHYGYPRYRGSGASLTNQHNDSNNWTSLTKFVAAPEDAHLEGGYWYAADGTLIGKEIWANFAITQDVTSGGQPLYTNPVGPGQY